MVVVLRPPYQFDAATPGQRIAFSQFFGQHGYLPNLVDLAHNVNMHATFIASGPGIAQEVAGPPRRAGDRHRPDGRVPAPHPGPAERTREDPVRPPPDAGQEEEEKGAGTGGAGLTGRAAGPKDLREITILNISDYHGQLIPLAEAADNVTTTGAINQTYNIGGSAFLKPWFDAYRREARNGSITVTAGDAVGATPPISSFFGDKPTIEMMNLMGFYADGLGNHNFDRGEQYFRNELEPLARVPVPLRQPAATRRARRRRSGSRATSSASASDKVGLDRLLNPDAPDARPAGCARAVHDRRSGRGGERRGAEAPAAGREDDRRHGPHGRHERRDVHPRPGRS